MNSVSALEELAVHAQEEALAEVVANDLAKLLEHIYAQWKSYKESRARSMHSMVIPADIQTIVFAGVRYDFPNHKREFWFRRTESGYNRNRFFLTEAVDPKGQAWQLELSRGQRQDGSVYYSLYSATPLGASGSSYGYRGTGPRSPRD